MEGSIVVGSNPAASASDFDSEDAAISSSGSSEEKTTAITTITAPVLPPLTLSRRAIPIAPHYQDRLTACRESCHADLEILINKRCANNNKVCRYTLSALLKEAVEHPQTLLHFASSKDAFTSYSILIQHKATDPNRVLLCYGDLLGLLAMENELDDANTNLEDAQGRTPDQLAKECHQPAILEKLGKLPSSSLALPPFMPSPGSTESGSLFLERTIRIYERITVFFISLVFFCVYQSRKMYRP
ncbi:uncharacterized protein EURHEDRAFT_548494 [Aspergillus ruber CBS 135680]|uniref:Uncharacterized protein n=1 Tax=Aspergillus ruber (strain CBS 135680) TaxID=1388766 RepID=A0A017S3Z1_ASPRC|nr:uncharacterized protein EURHEDRAFT_548494 [Aspergillus ruber CBS 135680]EYE90910.1 hypothetical protein EURHEDRAFT_548494 [Aspergillus ruber CBS 135680]